MRALVLALAACGSSATVPAPVAIPDPPPPGLRLPGDVAPTLYHLELTVVPDAATSRGKVAIDATVIRATRVVWLDATGLTIGNATLAGARARVIPGGDDYIGLTLDRELPIGPLAIAVEFTAPIDHQKSRGIYAEKEGADSYAYTFFESIDARRAFPCFDEPNYKVPWQLTFHVKVDHVAAGNAAVVGETPEADGMKRVELAPSKPLPSYLVAFVVGPFEVVDDGTTGRGPTPVRFIVPKGRAAELAYAKAITPKVVAALEDYFDMAYPYGKLEVAVVPRYWGTMEHPGIVAMGQPLALITAEQATRDRRERYTNILAHELGHYWFGDYVTLAWWDDTWLNEALGEWLDLIITNVVEPSWHVFDHRLDRATGAMAADEALTTKAIRQPVTTREGIEAAFDGEITYLKGSSVLHMFEAHVGADRWQTFIRAYIRAHAWGNATADDLFTAVKAQLGPEVERGLRSFVEQPGVPRIAIETTCTTLTLHQQRALPAGVTDPVARVWSVPVCVRYGDGKTSHRACTMLAAPTGTLAVEGGCPTWTIANAEASGYYRSVVDGTLPASATVDEKLMLVSDLRAAIERGELAIDKSLALAPKLAVDADDRVARRAFEAASANEDGLDDATYAKVVRYHLAMFRPLARKLGWRRGPNDTEDRHELRRHAMGVAYHDDTLAKEAGVLALAWLADRKAADDDMVSTILTSATHHGDAALFDKLLAAARAPRDRTEQERLLFALGGFTDPAIVARALALALGTDFDLRDSISIVARVVATRETRALGLAFVEAHLDELLPRMRDDEASELLSRLSDACDRATIDRVAKLVVPRAKKVGGADAAVTRGLEQSEQCLANAKRQAPALAAFLAKF